MISHVTPNNTDIDNLCKILNNLIPSMMFSRIENYIHAVPIDIMGESYLTISDYDGNVWLIKVYSGKNLIWDNITTTPVELVRLIDQTMMGRPKA